MLIIICACSGSQASRTLATPALPPESLRRPAPLLQSLQLWRAPSEPSPTSYSPPLLTSAPLWLQSTPLRTVLLWPPIQEFFLCLGQIQIQILVRILPWTREVPVPGRWVWNDWWGCGKACFPTFSGTQEQCVRLKVCCLLAECCDEKTWIAQVRGGRMIVSRGGYLGAGIVRDFFKLPAYVRALVLIGRDAAQIGGDGPIFSPASEFEPFQRPDQSAHASTGQTHWKPDHRNFKPAGDQVVRNLLQGMVKKHRPDSTVSHRNAKPDDRKPSSGKPNEIKPAKKKGTTYSLKTEKGELNSRHTNAVRESSKQANTSVWGTLPSKKRWTKRCVRRSSFSKGETA